MGWKFVSSRCSAGCTGARCSRSSSVGSKPEGAGKGLGYADVLSTECKLSVRHSERERERERARVFKYLPGTAFPW